MTSDHKQMLFVLRAGNVGFPSGEWTMEKVPLGAHVGFAKILHGKNATISWRAMTFCHKLMETHVLTPDENALLRAAIQRLIDKHGSLNAVALLLRRNQAGLWRIMEGHGGSLHTAALVARELGVDVREMLQKVLPQLPPVSELPGYREALVEARRIAGTKHSDAVWEMVGNMIFGPLKTVDAAVLLKIAELAQMTRVRNLTAGSDMAPPSRPPVKRQGGHRPSGTKIKKR